MKLQVIRDAKGKNTGVFIPIEDCALIKSNYPDIESIQNEIPDWQKQLLDKRTKNILANNDLIQPIDGLFEELDS